MSREWWFTIAAMLVMATLWRNRLRAYLEQASANVRAFDLPSARAYDALVASILECFYARVAGEVAAAHPGGKVLEVGSGPGRLAVRLAREAPSMTLTGVDISDAMVERAARRASVASLREGAVRGRRCRGAAALRRRVRRGGEHAIAAPLAKPS